MPTKEQLRERRKLVMQAIAEYQFTVAPDYKPTEKEIDKFIKNDAHFSGFEHLQEFNQNRETLAQVAFNVHAIGKESYRHGFSRFVPLLLQSPKVNSKISTEDIEKMNLHNEKVKASLAPGAEGDQYELECLKGFLKKAEDYVIDFSCKNFNEFAANHTIPDYDVLEIFYNLEPLQGRMAELGSPIPPDRMKALQDKYVMLEVLKKQMNSIVDLSTRPMAHYLPGIDILKTPQQDVDMAQMNIAEMMAAPDSDYNTQYTAEQKEQIGHLRDIYSYIPAYYVNADYADRSYMLGKTLSKYIGKNGFEGECYDEAGNHIEFADLVRTAINKDISFMVANPEEAVGKDQKNLLVVTMKNGKFSTSSKKIAKFPKIVQYRKDLAVEILKKQEYDRVKDQAVGVLEYLKNMELENAASKTELPDEKPQEFRPVIENPENPQRVTEAVPLVNAEEKQDEQKIEESEPAVMEEAQPESNRQDDSRIEPAEEKQDEQKTEESQPAVEEANEEKAAEPEAESKPRENLEDEIVAPEVPEQSDPHAVAMEEPEIEEPQENLEDEIVAPEVPEQSDPQAAAMEEPEIEEPQENLEDEIVAPEVPEQGDPQAAAMKEPEIEKPQENLEDEIVAPEVPEQSDPLAAAMEEPEIENKMDDPKADEPEEIKQVDLRAEDVKERKEDPETKEAQPEDVELDKESGSQFIGQGNHVQNPPEEEAKITDAQAHRTEADIPAARASLLKYADRLEKVKSKFKNSPEYYDLINTMRQVGKGEYPAVGEGLTPQQQFAYELSRIHDKTEKYLEHKAKDGVKKNVYKKLLVVEQSNKFLKSCLEPYSDFELPLNTQISSGGSESELPKKVSEIHVTLEDRKKDLPTNISGKAYEPLPGYGEALVNKCKGAGSMTDKEKGMVSNGIRDVDHCMCKIIMKAEKNGNANAVRALFAMRKSFLQEPFPAVEEVRTQEKTQKAEPAQKNDGISIMH